MRPMFDPIPILLDADGVVVVDKPAGLESTGKDLDDPRSVQHRLARQLRRPVWAVHQLDRDTSGVLVFVRKKGLVAPWQDRLSAKLGARKRYLAIVRGEVSWERTHVDAKLAYSEDERRWEVRDDGKVAQTELTRRGCGRGASLVEARLLTGRTHQARVHLAHVGHPVLGDRRYGDGRAGEPARQMLHAWRLEVPGLAPFEAPVPDDMREVALSLELTFALP